MKEIVLVKVTWTGVIMIYNLQPRSVNKKKKASYSSQELKSSKVDSHKISSAPSSVPFFSAFLFPFLENMLLVFSRSSNI